MEGGRRGRRRGEVPRGGKMREAGGGRGGSGREGDEDDDAGDDVIF